MRFAMLVAHATRSVPRKQFLQQKTSSVPFCEYQKRIAFFFCNGLNIMLHLACWRSGYHSGNSSENVLYLCMSRQSAASEIFIGDRLRWWGCRKAY
jgi:hypothetical protein